MSKIQLANLLLWFKTPSFTRCYGEGHMPGCPYRVRVRAGVVVLGHAPACNLTVVLIELLQGVVWLWNTDGSHIMVEAGKLTVTMGVQDDKGDVVSAVTTVLTEGVKLVVLDDLLDPGREFRNELVYQATRCFALLIINN